MYADTQEELEDTARHEALGAAISPRGGRGSTPPPSPHSRSGSRARAVAGGGPWSEACCLLQRTSRGGDVLARRVRAGAAQTYSRRTFRLTQFSGLGSTGVTPPRVDPCRKTGKGGRMAAIEAGTYIGYGSEVRENVSVRRCVCDRRYLLQCWEVVCLCLQAQRGATARSSAIVEAATRAAANHRAAGTPAPLAMGEVSATSVSAAMWSGVATVRAPLTPLASRLPRELAIPAGICTSGRGVIPIGNLTLAGGGH